MVGGRLAALADDILQAALDLSSLELVKRGSGRLRGGIQTDANARGRAESSRWDLERHAKCSTEDKETQGSGWSRISLGQEELRSWPSDQDGLLAVDGTHFMPKRKLWLLPAVGTPGVCHITAQGVRREPSGGYA